MHIVDEIGTLLMLIVSELGEALEAHRKGDMKNFAEELADVAIRLGDLCGGLDIDLEWEIIQKMEYNQTRPRLHGKDVFTFMCGLLIGGILGLITPVLVAAMRREDGDWTQ